MNRRWQLLRVALLVALAMLPMSQAGAASAVSPRIPIIGQDGCVVVDATHKACPLQSGVPVTVDQSKWEFVVTPPVTNVCPAAVTIYWADHTHFDIVRTSIAQISNQPAQCLFDFPVAGHSGSLLPSWSDVVMPSSWSPSNGGRFYTSRGPAALPDGCIYRDATHMKCPLQGSSPGNNSQKWQFVVSPPGQLGCPGFVSISWLDGTKVDVKRTWIISARRGQSARCVFETPVAGHSGAIDTQTSYVAMGIKWRGQFYIAGGPKV